MAAKTTNTKKDSLLIALRRGNAEKVRKIIADSEGDVGEIHADMAADSAMNALLHRAARYGHGKVVQVSEHNQLGRHVQVEQAKLGLRTSLSLL